MVSSISSKTPAFSKREGEVEEKVVVDNSDLIPANDADFGGPEARQRLERKLLWKLDARMSILVVIYILNYVSH